MTQRESNSQPIHLELDTSPLSPGSLGSSQTSTFVLVGATLFVIELSRGRSF